jgi:hypothetical protein
MALADRVAEGIRDDADALLATSVPSRS